VRRAASIACTVHQEGIPHKKEHLFTHLHNFFAAILKVLLD
jgi:hypothetical protein